MSERRATGGARCAPGRAPRRRSSCRRPRRTTDRAGAALIGAPRAVEQRVEARGRRQLAEGVEAEPVSGGSGGGSWRRRIRPRRRPSAMASSPPSSNVRRELDEARWPARRRRAARGLQAHARARGDVRRRRSCRSARAARAGRPARARSACRGAARPARAGRAGRPSPGAGGRPRRRSDRPRTTRRRYGDPPPARRSTRRAASTSGSSGIGSLRDYSGTISRSSTSKMSVEPGLIRGGAPRSP